MPSNDSPAAKGTTTEKIAVAAVSAAITEAWASSPGCSEPVRRDTLESPVTVIARFCQPHPESSHHLAVTGGRGRVGLKCIVKLCNHGYMSQTLGADLLSVVARINRLATQRARLPLPYAQARLLSTIEDQGATRISDLAALDHCSQPTMTTQVRRLEDAGLVSRTVDPGDARAVLIRITPKGVETLRQARLDRGAAVDPYLERLDVADRQTLSEAVRVLRGLLADAASPITTK